MLTMYIDIKNVYALMCHFLAWEICGENVLTVLKIYLGNAVTHRVGMSSKKYKE